MKSFRQWGNLASMAAMIALPWALINASNTSYWYGIAWSALLSLHIISLLIPKRYAITRTHLFLPMGKGMIGIDCDLPAVNQAAE